MNSANQKNNPIPYTDFGRPVDPNYPTNRAILIVMGASLIIFGIKGWIGSKDILGALTTGFVIALEVFLAWAFTREIDPDHEYSAFASAALTLAAAWALGPTALLPTAGWLLLARMLSQTTGSSPNRMDSLFLALFSFYAVWQLGGIYGLALAAAFFLDGYFTPGKREHTAAGLILAALIIYRWDFSFPPEANSLYVCLTAAMVFIPLMAASRTLRSVCDHFGNRLKPQRVQSAQIVSLAGICLTVLFSPAGMVGSLPGLAGLLGAGVYNLGGMVTRR